MSSGLNYLDLAFISFALIFVVTAFLRGFVKEIFALLNWVISLTLSYLLAPHFSKLLEHYSSNKLIIDISARSIIFVMIFFTIAVSTSGLSTAIKEKMPKLFDRSLGVLFGIIKTLLIFGFIYALTLNLYGFLIGKQPGNTSKPADQIPSWAKEAKCYSILKYSGEALDPLVKKFFDAISKNLDQVIPSQQNLDEKINEVLEQKDKFGDGSEAGSQSSSSFDENSG